MRLSHYIAKCGISSRRGAEPLINSGRVMVNNVPVFVPRNINPADDSISVDGRIIVPASHRYYALHKPVKYMCTLSHRETRKRAIDLIHESDEGLFTVGRLDYYTSGLLLITNDGDFAQKISHPKYVIEREYVVTSTHAVSAQSLQRAHRLDGYTVKSIKPLSANSIQVIICEGKNREVRKIMAACGVEISGLQRVRIGTISLGSLRVGEYRMLTEKEISAYA